MCALWGVFRALAVLLINLPHGVLRVSAFLFAYREFAHSDVSYDVCKFYPFRFPILCSRLRHFLVLMFGFCVCLFYDGWRGLVLVVVFLHPCRVLSLSHFRVTVWRRIRYVCFHCCVFCSYYVVFYVYFNGFKLERAVGVFHAFCLHIFTQFLCSLGTAI